MWWGGSRRGAGRSRKKKAVNRETGLVEGTAGTLSRETRRGRRVIGEAEGNSYSKCCE